MKKAITFLYGLGDLSEYKSLSKYFHIPRIDWNKSTITPKIGRVDVLVGFSLGCILAYIHAEKNKVKTLIMCSPTPAESLKTLKVKKIIFLVGEKEKWCLKEIQRVAKTLKCGWKVIVIPKADHRIIGNYRKKLLEVVNEIENN
ncbi:MAG: hypothetical protein UT65_C0016G0011 [Parcubacteria group bacterium GW2011_GWF2_39_8b]|uniref:Alpha/beta hydrolase n=3 Tax=Candidatus Zambryskiibacteriota TaxID=1817925 RepID=A0A1G2TB51_9BACT|nr:MAG: hypothetical protein UT65_C0016G0011 [Parcubacteria group bacterium GW2011_GWF2_39_8b]KKR46019.1 MAG: hypothetical protein UT81_C0003G0036 [Parcubacteria group bacterium GW2011_GWA2_40_14]OHA93949.1 MAG: hypothetical protein A2W58_01055 [Candidatus Zambryskibacteria bacterium RIFCSPHIGHO2_02_38_10.5]OHA95511.1 MAG: hypothetical protein A3C63_00505 [Candidatus Zambryskibacteria bacterium RIFCSPHIGHO2_02_FULL_39_82]OHA98931.1 MAG: hypothetical protein A3E32_01360 [Candidatus Zambryskibact